LAGAPTASSIEWAKGTPKVPVEVAATGPKVIAASARHADRILFALGADPGRVGWGIELARQAAADAGRNPDELTFGAYVNVVCHHDLDVARVLGRGGTGLFARFSVMHGTVSGPADASQREVFHDIHDRYDMNAHGQHGGSQTTALTDDFMDDFAILGNPGHCIERLHALVDLGIDKFAVTGPNFLAKSPEAQTAASNMTDHVLPAFR
jgi:5,10-methylenetetrahydromethanopterin reductase